MKKRAFLLFNIFIFFVEVLEPSTAFVRATPFDNNYVSKAIFKIFVKKKLINPEPCSFREGDQKWDVGEGYPLAAIHRSTLFLIGSFKVHFPAQLIPLYQTKKGPDGIFSQIEYPPIHA